MYQFFIRNNSDSRPILIYPQTSVAQMKEICGNKPVYYQSDINQYSQLDDLTWSRFFTDPNQLVYNPIFLCDSVYQSEINRVRGDSNTKRRKMDTPIIPPQGNRINIPIPSSSGPMGMANILNRGGGGLGITPLSQLNQAQATTTSTTSGSFVEREGEREREGENKQKPLQSRSRFSNTYSTPYQYSVDQINQTPINFFLPKSPPSQFRPTLIATTRRAINPTNSNPNPNPKPVRVASERIQSQQQPKNLYPPPQPGPLRIGRPIPIQAQMPTTPIPPPLPPLSDWKTWSTYDNILDPITDEEKNLLTNYDNYININEHLYMIEQWIERFSPNNLTDLYNSLGDLNVDKNVEISSNILNHILYVATYLMEIIDHVELGFHQNICNAYSRLRTIYNRWQYLQSQNPELHNEDEVKMMIINNILKGLQESNNKYQRVCYPNVNEYGSSSSSSSSSLSSTQQTQSLALPENVNVNRNYPNVSSPLSLPVLPSIQRSPPLSQIVSPVLLSPLQPSDILSFSPLPVPQSPPPSSQLLPIKSVVTTDTMTLPLPPIVESLSSSLPQLPILPIATTTSNFQGGHQQQQIPPPIYIPPSMLGLGSGENENFTSLQTIFSSPTTTTSPSLSYLNPYLQQRYAANNLTPPANSEENDIDNNQIFNNTNKPNNEEIANSFFTNSQE